MDKADQEEFVRLLRVRTDMEKEIIQLQEILNANNNVGMDESLVDDEGFPRTDIDVYQVKHARAKLIREQTDLKTLVKRCEDIMTKVNAALKASQEGDDKPARASLPQSGPRKLAVVGIIAEGSPFDVAGLKVGDIILELGTINGTNMRDVESLTSEIEKSVDTYIKVIVERDSQIKRFNLKPKAWAGEGFMGCELYAMS